uniref:Uncharacterized protein n=1 Tax=Glycine max TaxID=3847 RepID=C6TF20_SOYBN|nr:unknown [Glycine max]
MKLGTWLVPRTSLTVYNRDQLNPVQGLQKSCTYYINPCSCHPFLITQKHLSNKWTNG